MIESNLAYNYVNNIPWNKYPAFAFSNDSEYYLNAFQNVVDKIPDENLKVSFENSVWDFNPYYDGINDRTYRIDFSQSTNELIDYSKFFVLYNIMNKTKISTTHVRYSCSKGIINNIVANTYHKSIFVITTDDVINEITRRNASPSTNHNLYESIYQFYYFLINNYKLNLPIDIKEIKKLGVKEKAIVKNQDTKLPNIPEEYFNKILNMSVNVMRSNTGDYNARATACLLVILSQTGLRLGDLLSLKIDQLFFKHLHKSNNKAYYIHYTCRKPSKPHEKMLEFDIFCTPLCSEAFNILKDIRKNCEFSSTNDYLYILNPTFNSHNTFPIIKKRFNSEYKDLLYYNLPIDCFTEWEGISPSTLAKWDKKSKILKNHTIYPPDTRQYRVHLCTTLYERGVPLAYIQKYMAHLSDYMRGYYVRPKDTYQENIQYSEKVIREIATDNITPLGDATRTIGNAIKNNIQKFIKDNNFNVETDIKSILSALGDTVIIRGKTGGVCIKTSLMPCSKDARTNEMLCAYNLCPNLFHFYYMIDVSYLNFQTLQETYQTSKSSGYIRAAQKELNKIKDLLRRRLIPELDELENEVIKKGIDIIIEQYPSLRDIAFNREIIRKESELWMKEKC